MRSQFDHKLKLALKALVSLMLLNGLQPYTSLGQVKQINSFALAGQLPPSHNRTVYLLDQQNIRVDSSIIEANQFKLTGKVAEPTLYYLQIDTIAKKYSVFLEASPMQIVIQPNGTYQLEGSSVHTQWEQYSTHTDHIRDQLVNIYQLRQEAKLKGDTVLFNRLGKQNDSIWVLHYAYLNEHITQKPYSYFNLYLLTVGHMGEAYDLNMLNEFRPQLAQYPTFRRLDEELKQKAAVRQKIAVGQSAYNFSLPDSSGTAYTLQSLRKTNKLILVDFWASWCGPCLKELPALKTLYQQYAHQGLVIIGISVDDDAGQWRKALSKHQPAGLQLLAGTKAPLLEKYVIDGIPQTFLIDEDGRIQAHSLRGDELKQKVIDLLSKAP